MASDLEPPGGEPETRSTRGGLDLFRHDAFDRLLTRVGLPADTGGQAFVRGLGLLVLSAVPLLIAAAFEGHLLWRDSYSGRLVPRMSFLLDVPTWTQIII